MGRVFGLANFIYALSNQEVAWLAFNNMMHGTYGYNDTPKYDPSTSEGSKETKKLETFLKDFSKERNDVAHLACFSVYMSQLIQLTIIHLLI